MIGFEATNSNDSLTFFNLSRADVVVVVVFVSAICNDDDDDDFLEL